jgi:plastocyanin
MRIFFFLSSLFCAFLINAQITISEISYNPPESNADSLEYIELYNLSTDPVDLSGWSFSEGVRLDSFDFTMEGGAYALIAINARAVKTVFGVDADMVWEEGALRNGGESITLVNAVGETVVSLTYADDGDWPSEADGTDSAGGSIELCDVNADPSDGSNWRVSMGSTGVVINGNEVLGTPRQANSVTCEVQPAVEIVGVGVTWTPADVTINLGETVRWINGGGTHNVNGTLAAYPDNPEGFGNGSPSSDPWVYDYTFTVAGVYDYKCDLHEGAGMLGTVTVIDPNVVIPDLVITEIMYNDPGENDELEFIEIFNNSDESVNLDGVSFSSGVNHTFSGESIAAQSTMILCKDAAAFERTFGFTAMAWAEGDLDNMGETLSLMDGSGNTIDQVTYGVDGDWPAEANGGGSSLVLCNISGDNNDGANWRFLDMEPAFQDGSISVFASPGQLLPCAVDVATVTQVDEMGVNTWLGKSCCLVRIGVFA